MRVRILKEVNLGGGDIYPPGEAVELDQGVAVKLISRGFAEEVRAVPIVFLGPTPLIDSRSYSRGEKASIAPDVAARYIETGLAMPIVDLDAEVDPAVLPEDPRTPHDPEDGAPMIRGKALTHVPMGGRPFAWGRRPRPAYISSTGRGGEMSLPEPAACRAIALGRFLAYDKLTAAGAAYLKRIEGTHETDPRQFTYGELDDHRPAKPEKPKPKQPIVRLESGADGEKSAV
jgi:hypothetical protein